MDPTTLSQASYPVPLEDSKEEPISSQKNRVHLIVWENLPLELWSQTLTNLENDLKALSRCARVSRRLYMVVSQLLNKIWKPAVETHFSYMENDFKFKPSEDKWYSHYSQYALEKMMVYKSQIQIAKLKIQKKGPPNDLDVTTLLQRPADDGFAEAQYWLAQALYEKGDYKEGYKYVSRSADQGYSPAQVYQAECLLHGRYVNKNEEKAIELFQLAAEQGNLDAHYHLGRCFLYGDGVHKNPEKAFELFSLAAEQGHADAQFFRGMFYHHGIEPVQKNTKKALESFQLLAQQGVFEGQVFLSHYNQLGIETPKNEKEAFRLRQLAAKKGNSEALYNIDFFFLNAIGTERNPDQAFHLPDQNFHLFVPSADQ